MTNDDFQVIDDADLVTATGGSFLGDVGGYISDRKSVV